MTRARLVLPAGLLGAMFVSSCVINPQPEPPDQATAAEPGVDASSGGFGGQAYSDGGTSPEGSATGGNGGSGGCDNCSGGGDAEADTDDAGDATSECDGDSGDCEASVDAGLDANEDAPDADEPPDATVQAD